MIINGFTVVGGETENFMQFASQRGKCNDIDSTNTIKRNLMIINKNISAIAKFSEQQSKWLDQLNTYEEEIHNDPHCEACFKHCPLFTMLKGLTGRPPV